jgi:hypothetical protein
MPSRITIGIHRHTLTALIEQTAQLLRSELPSKFSDPMPPDKVLDLAEREGTPNAIKKGRAEILTRIPHHEFPESVEEQAEFIASQAELLRDLLHARSVWVTATIKKFRRDHPVHQLADGQWTWKAGTRFPHRRAAAKDQGIAIRQLLAAADVTPDGVEDALANGVKPDPLRSARAMQGGSR